MKKSNVVLLLVLVAVLAVSCGGNSDIASPVTSDTLSGNDGDSTRFSLNVWQESNIYGSDTGEVSLRRTDRDELTELEVIVSGATDLRALYFDIEYDSDSMHLQEVRTADLIGEADSRLELTVADRPQRIFHGQVAVRPQEAEGFSGSGSLATFVFAPGAADLVKRASAAPATNHSRAVASFDGNAGILSWGYASQGDYDQNSITNISDLTPLGVHFQKEGPFDYFSVEAVVDGDANGEINIADITPIGVNFGSRVSEYNLYLSQSLDAYPAANDSPSAIASLATVEYADFSGSRHSERLRIDSAVSGSGDAYIWVRPSDGISEGTPSAALQVTLGTLGNINPVAKLNVPVTSGIVPFAVNFDASTSSDPDGGSTLGFEWDLDGDGSYETDTGNTPQASHVYEDAGIYIVRMRVTDSGGGSSVASIAITANVAGNQLPTAHISSDTDSGSLPLSVNFDASASTDPDGSITSYMWDFNGDGTFDHDSGSSPLASHTYESTGSFDAVVKVTDDLGGSDLASLSGSGGNAITVDPADNGNLPPEPALTASLLSGTAPLSIDFDASASTDPDGVIVRFEWDFNGDGIFDHDSGSNPLASFEFSISGLFNTAVRVTDDDGATATISLEDLGLGLIDILGGGGNQDPVASFGVDVAIGTAPLQITLNAGASNDPDGIIVKFEWDCDGDGIFEIDNGNLPLLVHLFDIAGDFDVSLRVTDDDGATDVVSVNELLGSLISINAPPELSFEVNTLLGLAPLLVSFDASASIDPDGTIELFEWDYDGDGEFDESGGLLGLVNHLYIALGVYDPVLRCTDDDGAVVELRLSDFSEDLIEVSIL